MDNITVWEAVQLGIGLPYRIGGFWVAVVVSIALGVSFSGICLWAINSNNKKFVSFLSRFVAWATSVVLLTYFLGFSFEMTFGTFIGVVLACLGSLGLMSVVFEGTYQPKNLKDDVEQRWNLVLLCSLCFALALCGNENDSTYLGLTKAERISLVSHELLSGKIEDVDAKMRYVSSLPGYFSGLACLCQNKRRDAQDVFIDFARSQKNASPEAQYWQALACTVGSREYMHSSACREYQKSFVQIGEPILQLLSEFIYGGIPEFTTLNALQSQDLPDSWRGSMESALALRNQAGLTRDTVARLWESGYRISSTLEEEIPWHHILAYVTRRIAERTAREPYTDELRQLVPIGNVPKVVSGYWEGFTVLLTLNFTFLTVFIYAPMLRRLVMSRDEERNIKRKRST